jgi:hypothetical protein
MIKFRRAAQPTPVAQTSRLMTHRPDGSPLPTPSNEWAADPGVAKANPGTSLADDNAPLTTVGPQGGESGRNLRSLR